MRVMQAFGYTWNADIRVRVECRISGMRRMRTFGYVWNAVIRVCVLCVECRHSDMRGMRQSVEFSTNSHMIVKIKNLDSTGSLQTFFFSFSDVMSTEK